VQQFRNADQQATEALKEGVTPLGALSALLALAFLLLSLTLLALALLLVPLTLLTLATLLAITALLSATALPALLALAAVAATTFLELFHDRAELFRDIGGKGSRLPAFGSLLGLALLSSHLPVSSHCILLLFVTSRSGSRIA